MAMSNNFKMILGRLMTENIPFSMSKLEVGGSITFFVYFGYQKNIHESDMDNVVWEVDDIDEHHSAVRYYIYPTEESHGIDSMRYFNDFENEIDMLIENIKSTLKMRGEK